MFIFEHSIGAETERYRIRSGPKATKRQSSTGHFVVGLEKGVQVQLEACILNGQEAVHCQLITEQGQHLPIGSELMRLIRGLMWHPECIISFRVPPHNPDVVEVNPYRITLLNEKHSNN
jgi:hypothetical protein